MEMYEMAITVALHTVWYVNPVAKGARETFHVRFERRMALDNDNGN
ncbi:MAG: hypothetical protein ACKPKO_01415 [Candidatus Fonsibacter sp.]